VLSAQGRDFSGQRPDETKAFCRRAGNEVVVPTVRHLVYGCVLPVHALKVPFLPNDINLILPPNVPHYRLAEAKLEALRWQAVAMKCKPNALASSSVARGLATNQLHNLVINKVVAIL